jgi:hypothetical protein
VRERAATAMAALLLQLFFVLLFTHFLLTPQAQKERAREMLLLLRPERRLQPEPPPPVPQAPSRPVAIPPAFIPPSFPNPDIVGVKPEAPSGLEALGRALSGCAPEQMGNLSPQDRARCPPLGILPPKADQDLVEQPRSHAKDEALWAEEKAERDWMPNCVGAERVLKCLIQQSLAERDRAGKVRAQIEEERRRRTQPPPPPMPKRIGPAPRSAQ